jgi:hypothetical protein
VVESFDSGSLNSAWNTTSGTIATTHAHDGSYGIMDTGWIYRTDVSIHVGTVISGWVRSNAAASGRLYLGFDASSSGCKSFVAGFNVGGDIRFQNNVSYGHSELTVQSFSWTTGGWYYMEIEILAGGVAEGRLYAADGVTLLGSLTESYGTIGSGGVALRSFGNVSFDTLSICD